MGEGVEVQGICWGRSRESGVVQEELGAILRFISNGKERRRRGV